MSASGAAPGTDAFGAWVTTHPPRYGFARPLPGWLPSLSAAASESPALPARVAGVNVSHQLARWRRALRAWWRKRPPLPVWYHEHFRLPIHDIAEVHGIEPRRADLALWAALGAGNRHRLRVHEAAAVSWDHLGLVHTPAYLESLTSPRGLAATFGLVADDFPVDAVLATIRLATGATVAAARHVRDIGGPALNLLGGFHHGFPDKGGGLCPVNDIAVAIAVLRGDGLRGQIVVLDLDAHPPDGLAACLAHDPDVAIGSLSGSDWGPLPGVDETLIPGADDATYLAALDALLDRLPTPELAFVIAGGDVLAGDRQGRLRLTAGGVRRRDRAVRDWLDAHGAASVWTPGGGYGAHAWRALADTLTTLAGDDAQPVPADLEPMAAHFAAVARRITAEELGATPEDDEELFTDEDMEALFGRPAPGAKRLLGTYTRQGIEYALYAYGVLGQLHRLGYRAFEVEIDSADTGDRFRLYGRAAGARHLLVESIHAIETFAGHKLLVLHWLTLRHPLGRLADRRRRLPGQDVPGLGMAWEAGEIERRMATRLGCEGILIRPAWLHTAWIAASHFRFLDPAVQGAFEALRRDLGHVGLDVLTHAAAEGRLRCNGEPWPWPAAEMVAWLDGGPDDAAAVAEARDASHFSVAPQDPLPAPLPNPLPHPLPPRDPDRAPAESPETSSPPPPSEP